MSGPDDNKWRRRQSSQGNNASPSPSPSQNFSNQPRRSDSRSDRSSSFQQQNNRSFSNSNNNNSGFSGMMDEHVPVNGFNSKELKDLLNRAYQDALNAAQGSGDSKPVVWKSNDKGWTTQNKTAWAPNKHVMANGMDFSLPVSESIRSDIDEAQPGQTKDDEFDDNISELKPTIENQVSADTNDRFEEVPDAHEEEPVAGESPTQQDATQTKEKNKRKKKKNRRKNKATSPGTDPQQINDAEHPTTVTADAGTPKPVDPPEPPPIPKPADTTELDSVFKTTGTPEQSSTPKPHCDLNQPACEPTRLPTSNPADTLRLVDTPEGCDTSAQIHTPGPTGTVTPDTSPQLEASPLHRSPQSVCPSKVNPEPEQQITFPKNQKNKRKKRSANRNLPVGVVYGNGGVAQPLQVTQQPKPIEKPKIIKPRRAVEPAKPAEADKP
ncbi:hypothetical protein ABW19_dt0208786 [Dactylella cylindrospora]|nr:hypothetical protein ABW19_dt0208786 [Dactylella cylindrospora]